MKLFRIDVRLYATAYILAETEAEALETAKGLDGETLELSETDGSLPIFGGDYSSSDLPEVSLSPAMTVKGPDEGETPDVAADEDELYHEDEDEDEECEEEEENEQK